MSDVILNYRNMRLFLEGKREGKNRVVYDQ